MIRAVLDTNVLASGLTNSIGSPRLVIDFWTNGEFELVVSEHILQELERTLANRYFRKFMSTDQAINSVNQLRSEAILVYLTAHVSGIATHPEDDLVLATAVSGQAQFLVTGDKQLLKLQKHEGIRIVDATEFWQVLLSPRLAQP